MAITCTLSRENILALADTIYKKMVTTPQGEVFDVNAYMNYLFKGLEKAQGVDTAVQYMQQAPYVIRLIEAKLEDIELSIPLQELKELSKSFRNVDTGLSAIENYFGLTGLTDEQLAAKAKFTSNTPNSTAKDGEPEARATTLGDLRLLSRSILSSTGEEFYTRNPETKTADTVEIVDKDKLRIYNTISRIYRTLNDFDTNLGNPVYQGTEITLKPIQIGKLPTDQRTAETNALVGRMMGIDPETTKEKGITPINEVFLLVVSDRNGNPLYFDNLGNITTPENGKQVYQTLRDVRLSNGKYIVTNMYGRESKIISAGAEANLRYQELGYKNKVDYEKGTGKSFKTLVSEVEAEQQEQAKQLFNLRQKLIKGERPTIPIVGASRGVSNKSIKENIRLNQLDNLYPEMSKEILDSIQTLDIDKLGFEKGNTIIQVGEGLDQVFQVDRSDIKEELARKIAQVLTSDLSESVKFDYYTQFYAKEITDVPNNPTRRHLVYFDKDSGVLTFEYYNYTAKEIDLNKPKDLKSFSLDLKNPIATAEQNIYEVLMSGKSSASGRRYASKFDYNQDLINKGTYFDYENGERVEKDYLDFLKQQDAEIFLGAKGGLPLFNSYIKFAIPGQFEEDMNKAGQEAQDNRSAIRKFKDDLVEEIKNSPTGSVDATIVSSVKSTSNVGPTTYTYTIEIEGKEGQHKMYRSLYPLKQGDTLTLKVEDIVANGLMFKDSVTGNIMVNGYPKQAGVLNETDYNAKEAVREGIPVQTIKAQEIQQEESLEEVEPFEKTVSEDQAKASDINTTNPANTTNPTDNTSLTDLIDSFELDRSAKLPNGVTAEQIEKALNWWKSSPLNKYIKLFPALNLVNSDVYGKFVVSGARLITDLELDLDGKMGAILINSATGGTMVDAYHEAWHVFSQLFLGPQEKVDLYNEVRALKPEYAKLSSKEIEEMLAEDFRSYALNPKVIKSQPKRNSLFRRILNFLKKLFRIKPSTADLIRGEELATEGVAGELFQNLYFASKNPKLLNNYTPLIENIKWDELNRGIIQKGNKNENALSEYDSDLVVETIDSILSEVMDKTYTSKNALDASMAIMANEGNKEKFFQYAKNKLTADVKSIRDQIKVKPNTPFNSFETLKNLEDNAVAIIRSNKGEHKYVFLKSQVDDFENLDLDTKGGERIKGELYKGVIEVVGDFFKHKKINAKGKEPADILVVNTIEEAQAQFDAYREGEAKEFTSVDLYPERTVGIAEVDYEQTQLLDNLRILQSALSSWENTLEYYTDKSAFNIITKKVLVQEEDPEDQEAADDPTNVTEKGLGKVKANELTLQQLADKKVIYLLKSLYAVTREANGDVSYQYNKLGYKKLANFKKVWNAVVRATNGTKDPRLMYQRIADSVRTYPELEQLISTRLPNPELVGREGYAGNTKRAFGIVTSFWSTFSLPRTPFMQLTIFVDKTNLVDERGRDIGTTQKISGVEVTNASTDINNTIRKFENNFAAKTDGYFTKRDANNNTLLNLQKVVEQFTDRSGNFKTGSEYEFLNAIGFNLDDIGQIKSELSALKNAKFFGIDFIFRTIKELRDAEAAGSMSNDARKFLDSFLQKPISGLRRGVEPGVIGTPNSYIFREGFGQSPQVTRIITLQNKLGTTASTFSVQNPEKNRVNEHTTDSTLTVIADGINSVGLKTDMYRFGSTTQFLDPTMNPFADSSVTLKSLFEPTGERRRGRSIVVESVAGTQTISTISTLDPFGNFSSREETTGSNTTSLDKRGKFIQEIHTLLKSGRMELMRPGSKSSSFGWRVDGGITSTAISKKDPYLYLDIDTFLPNVPYENDAIETVVLPYLQSEVKRINIYKTNPEAKNYIGYNTESIDGKPSGELFNYFDGILTDDVKSEILEKVTNPGTSLIEYLKTDTKLADKIKAQIKGYFTNKTNALYDYLSDGKFLDDTLLNRVSVKEFTKEQKERTLLRAFMYNYWIHNVETSILFLGDIAQYNHTKQELHKRISGLISTGPRVRTDQDAQDFVNKILASDSYAKSQNIANTPYKGYVNTAIMQEVQRGSIYETEIRKGLTNDYEERYKFRNIPNKAELIRERVEKEVEKYTKKEIKEGDGQGYITFDAYRMLKTLQDKWSDQQEALYQKIVNGQTVSASEIVEMFPVYKLQNFGFLQGTVLPVTAMHKFALLPLIPGMIQNMDLDSLHRQMMEQNIHYVTFESGSKVGAVTSNGKADVVYDDANQDSIKKNIKFTKNTIHAGFLKEAASVNSKYKGEVVFSTQLRKLILSGLYRNGKLVNEDNRAIVENYESNVDFYTQLLKSQLLQEIEYDEKNGKLVGKPDKFLKLIQDNLERKDYPPHLLRALKTNKDGTLNGDLSYFIDRKTIEKTILSIVEKRFVRQYVNGEPLVQVASTFTNGLLTGGKTFQKPTDAERKKFIGSNTLPFYTTVDGKTSAMKVAIALQGEFEYLLNAKHIDEQPIGTIDRLNEMIKNEDWLNIGDNRKLVTLAAVRIPVQGLNSMEFMEVYEFLDPSAGNLIILPTEIVAKSGGDFDVDKLTTFFPNINQEGSLAKSDISNKDFFNKISKLSKKDKLAAIKQQKRAVQNNFISSISTILALPENYANLVRPNDTYILKDYADKLQDYVSTYDKFAKVNGDSVNLNKKGKKMISPTSTLEPLHNIAVHEQNLVGKAVLGIAASENALSPLFDAAGGVMPESYKATKYFNGRYILDTDNKRDYKTRLLLPHNKFENKISISDTYTVDGIDRISDVFSQGMNGWVDVEKDEWIFYIQGNYEIAPTFLYLIKAGVPVRDAVMFVSQPMIREYAEKQRLMGGDYGALLGVAPSQAQFLRYQAARDVANKYTLKYLSALMDPVRPDLTFNVTFRPYDYGAGKRESKPVMTNVTKRQLALEIQKGAVNPLSIGSISYSRGPKRVDIYVAPDVENKNYYDSAEFASSKAETKDGVLDLNTMESIIYSKKPVDQLSNPQIITEMAAFLHFLEIQKQLMGLSAMKRVAKPDTTTIRNFQEAYLRDVNIDALDENSKIDQEFKERLLKESVVSSLFDKSIITDVAAPMMDLVNNKVTNEAIKNIIATKNIASVFGTGTDGVVKFVDSYKDAMVNFIFQNYLTNFVDSKGNIVAVPENFRGAIVKNSKSLNNDAVFTGDTININLDNIRRDFAEKAYLVDSTSDNAYKSREGLKAFNANENPFADENQYIKYVLERAYWESKGLKDLELNQVALLHAYNPKAITGNTEYSFTKMILDTIEEFPGLKAEFPILEQLSGRPSTKGTFLLTLNDRDVIDGNTKSVYAANIGALGNKRIQKVPGPANDRISMLFSFLPTMAVYQHGHGITPFGLDQVLPVAQIEDKTTRAGNLFKVNYWNQQTLDLIYNKLVDNANSLFKNMLTTPLEFNNPSLVKAQPVATEDPEETIPANPVKTTTEVTEQIEETSTEETVEVVEQVQEAQMPIIPMTEEHSAQILKGTKVITNRANRLEDGRYTMPSGNIITLKYLGEAKVNPKTNIVTITNEKTGLVTTRTLDQFAKAEGYKDATDFKKRSILSQSLINGSTTRFIYQVSPVGNTTTVGDEVDGPITSGFISREENPEIDEFNQFLADNDNQMPKEFNASNGRRYLLNPNNLYDLVSLDGKQIFISNLDLRTGKIVNIPEPTVPVNEAKKKQLLSEINQFIKNFNLDLIMAEAGYNIYVMMENINNATTQTEIDKIEKTIKEFTC